VIGVHDELKGQVPIVFATLKSGTADANAKHDAANGMQQRVVEMLGGVAKPARVYIVNSLPKTRSGKLLRRSLRALAESRDPGDLCGRSTIRTHSRKSAERSSAAPKSADLGKVGRRPGLAAGAATGFCGVT
jgi:hypothetical protein